MGILENCFKTMVFKSKSSGLLLKLYRLGYQFLTSEASMDVFLPILNLKPRSSTGGRGILIGFMTKNKTLRNPRGVHFEREMTP